MMENIGSVLRTSERGISCAGADSGASHDEYDRNLKTTTTNEYVLNVAFGSFSLFTALQFVFALTANSQAMMADCAAMAVDAITYLFNYMAERIKHRRAPEKDKQWDPEVLKRQRKLQRLYLELIPPLVSVTTLVGVTIVSLKQAIEVLVEDRALSKPPDVFIMSVFSLLNLLLDGVNVCCFTRAEDQVFGLPTSFYGSTSEQTHDEEPKVTTLLKKGDNAADSTMYYSVAQEADTNFDMIDEDDDRSSKSSNHLNLNMCSAWTHVFADTLRSITTLLAACFSWTFPDILSPADADSWGAIFISIIIIVSLGPLIQGLISTATEIRELSLNHFSRRFY